MSRASIGSGRIRRQESGVRELAPLARGLIAVKEQILNFCEHRIASARIEAFNTIVSRVIHRACGVANLDFLFLNLRRNHCKDGKAPIFIRSFARESFCKNRGNRIVIPPTDKIGLIYYCTKPND